MRETAESLAAQMTAAGITPENVTSHPAYLPPAGGGPAFLRYAMNDDNQPVLGEWACTLYKDGSNGWRLWDKYGARNVLIVYENGTWVTA